MWTCRNCRTENEDGATVCAHCGEKLLPPNPGENVLPERDQKASIPSEAKMLRNTATTILALCIIAGIISLCTLSLTGVAFAFAIILSACVQYAVLFALARIVVDVNRIRRSKGGCDDD